MRVAIYTLGCKVNQYETQAMEQELRRRGHELVDFEDSADAYIVNTCSVTAVSDKKSRQMIRRAKRRSPNAVVAACGCYIQTHTDEAKGLGIDLIGGTGGRMAFLDLLEQEARDRAPRVAVDDSLRRPNPPVEPINFTLDLTDIPVGNIANGETVAGLKAGLGTAAEGDISVAEVNGEKVIEVKDAAAGQNSVTWEAPSNITTGVITITTEFTAINESSAADINFNRVNGKNFAYFQTKFGSTKSKFYLNAGNKDDKLKLTKDKKYKLVSVFDYNTNNVTITLSEGDNVLASHDSDTVSAFTDLAAQGAISNIMICQTGNGYTAGTVSADLYINSFTVSQEL